MIVLDTTILVYAVGDAHPLREPCRQVVAAIADGRLAATTTAEVLQEFTHVRARRRTRADAADRARDFATLLTPLLPVGEADLDAAWTMFVEHEALGAFDAVLAAAASKATHVSGLMSADRAFAAIRGLGYVDPAAWSASN